MNISDLKIKDGNPRLIKDDKFKKLVQSIKEFPKMMELRPIIYDPATMEILGGNMRLKALQELKYKEIPDNWVKSASELTEDEKKRFLITDNVGFGEWDWDILANEWDAEELKEWGMDLPDWAVDEKLEAVEDDYEIPDEIQTDIVLGDLFEIGEHRLLCGDSTDSDAVSKLMNGQKADMVFTDPPYEIENQDYHSNIFLFTENSHIFVMHDDKGIVDYLRQSKLDFNRFFVANFGFSSPISIPLWFNYYLAVSKLEITPEY